MKIYALFIKRNLLSKDLPLFKYNPVYKKDCEKAFNVKKFFSMGDDNSILYAITDNKNCYDFFKNSRDMKYFSVYTTSIPRKDYNYLVNNTLYSGMKIGIFDIPAKKCGETTFFTEKIALTYDEYNLINDETILLDLKGVDFSIQELDMFKSKIKKALFNMGLIQLCNLKSMRSNGADFGLIDNTFEDIKSDFDSMVFTSKYYLFIHLFKEILGREDG